MKSRRAMAVTISAAAVLAVSACGSSGSTGNNSSGGGGSGSGGSGSAINVAVLAPFTGDYAIYGQGYMQGIKTWIHQHGQPSVGGHTINVMQEDDGCSVSGGVAAFRRVEDQIQAVIGPSCSAEAPALAPLAAAKQIPLLDLGHAASITAGYSGGWIFRMTQPDVPNQYAFAQYLLPKWKQQGITKLGLIYDTTTTDADAAKSWTSAAHSQGAQLVASESFSEGTTDFTSQILKLKQAGAQAAILQVYGPDESNIIHQMGTLNYKVPLASAEDTPYPFVLNSHTGPGVNGIYFYSDFVSGSDNPALQSFDQAYQQVYPGKTPMDIAWEGYEAMMLLTKALQQPGATSGGTALQKALAGLKWSLGPISESFLSNGDQSNTLTYVGTVKNMKPEYVKLLVQSRTSFPDWKG